MANLKYIPDKAQVTTILGDGDGKADASILIGGSMTDKFVPIMYSSKWDGEAYVGINRKDVVVPKGEFGTFRDGKMELVIGNSRDAYYLTPSGRLEYEISFDNSLPTYIDLELDSPPGMEFWKQLALTEEEIEEGCYRPEDVIDSYAVYWHRRNNNYKTGKLGHLYRQFLRDAKGNKVWCDQEIDGNTWRIIPGNEEWLKQATYPITVGPTLGYETPGLTSQGSLNVNVRYVKEATDGTGGNVQNFHCAVNFIAGDFEVKVGIYRHSAGPGELLEFVTYTVAAIDNNIESSVDNDLLAASTDYWVGVTCSNVSTTIKFDNGGGGLSGWKKSGSTYSNELLDPAGGGGSNAAIMSIWVDYEPAAGVNYDVSLTLSASFGISQSAMSTTLASLTIASHFGVSNSAIATTFGNLTLSQSLGMSQSALAAALASITYSSSYSISQNASASALAALTISFVNALSHTGKVDALASLILNTQSGISSSILVDRKASLTLAAEFGISSNAQAETKAGLTLNQLIGLAAIGKVVALAGLTLSNILSISQTATVTIGRVTTPDERLFTITIESRHFTVEEEDRYFLVPKEDRHFDN